MTQVDASGRQTWPVYRNVEGAVVKPGEVHYTPWMHPEREVRRSQSQASHGEVISAVAGTVNYSTLRCKHYFQVKPISWSPKRKG